MILMRTPGCVLINANTFSLAYSLQTPLRESRLLEDSAKGAARVGSSCVLQERQHKLFSSKRAEEEYEEDVEAEVEEEEEEEEVEDEYEKHPKGVNYLVHATLMDLVHKSVNETVGLNQYQALTCIYVSSTLDAKLEHLLTYSILREAFFRKSK
ncbi:Uncharacterized protein Rs2_32898 [Raphanus sativus]|nr:Uncharacterized protein Rs2_32898 [Raphanus sativus]